MWYFPPAVHTGVVKATAKPIIKAQATAKPVIKAQATAIPTVECQSLESVLLELEEDRAIAEADATFRHALLADAEEDCTTLREELEDARDELAVSFAAQDLNVGVSRTLSPASSYSSEAPPLPLTCPMPVPGM